MKTTARVLAYGALIASVALAGVVTARAADLHLLNVSYDPTREFYEDYDQAFATYWNTKTGDKVTIDQSHGGSGKQAQAVIDGLDADVVTLAVQGDIDAIVTRSGKIDAKWRGTLENNNTPYSSTVVFLVRKGNPKGINDWGDLIKDDVEVITPNPKTSGGARWAYLAAWNYGFKSNNGDQAKAQDFVRQVYAHVPVLGTGARDSTVTFAQKGLGDVYLAWENEAYLVVDEFGADNFDIVYPPTSIRAEPPVAVVDTNAAAHGTTDLAKAYLEYLYSPEGQTIAAKHHYRPSKPDLVTDQALLQSFPKLDLVTIDDPEFGGWAKAQPTHFGDGGTFDQIYSAQ
ncbi:MAG: sulfate ABC transporter substrate-binding protein [Devosia sp.]